MSTLLLTHPSFLEHDTGEDHPECADRLRAILSVLEGEEFMFLHREQAPRASFEQIAKAHPQWYIDNIMRSIPSVGYNIIDGDTIVSPGSGEAALRAAGAVCAAVDAVMKKEVRNVFCAVRPPGHHAEPHQAMGFCLFNNVVIGAHHARDAYGLKRVAIVDFDVHHGNGTQSMCEDDPGLFYVSTHQAPLYPGTGFSDETGIDNNILNIPLAPGSGSAEIRQAFEEKIIPAIAKFSPELIVTSAGFDAHIADPIAHLRLRSDDYGWITNRLTKLAEEKCGHRLISVLEGGYDLNALAASVRIHVLALMGI